MNNIIEHLIFYVPLTLLILEIIPLYLGITRIFVARKEFVEKFNQERKNLKENVRKTFNKR